MACKRTKTIYFFGAGASAAEAPTTPTSSEIYRLVRQGLVSEDPRFETLRAFLAAWAPGEFKHMPTTEELLSIIDGCLVKGEPIGEAWSISQLARVREELVTCLYRFIGVSSSPDHPGSDHGVYQRLLERVGADDTSLISLNYDLLLDRAIARVGLRPDYQLDFERLDRDDPQGKPLKLFKLHGSLNWCYCTSCFTTVRIGPVQVLCDAACRLCGGRLEALIIPPTPLKVAPSPFLSALWKKAEWELTQAREIVFIGYSLSEADANIRYLLFRSFFGYAPEVKVVLNRADAVVRGRYERLFPGGVRFYWEGFERFLGP